MKIKLIIKIKIKPVYNIYKIPLNTTFLLILILLLINLII